MSRIARSNCGYSQSQMIRQGLSTELANINMGTYLKERKSDRELKSSYVSRLSEIAEKSLINHFKSNDHILFKRKSYNRSLTERLLRLTIDGYNTTELMYIISKCENIKEFTNKKILKLILSYL